MQITVDDYQWECRQWNLLLIQLDTLLLETDNSVTVRNSWASNTFIMDSPVKITVVFQDPPQARHKRSSCSPLSVALTNSTLTLSVNAYKCTIKSVHLLL